MTIIVISSSVDAQTSAWKRSADFLNIKFFWLSYSEYDTDWSYSAHDEKVVISGHNETFILEQTCAGSPLILLRPPNENDEIGGVVFPLLRELFAYYYVNGNVPHKYTAEQFEVSKPLQLTELSSNVPNTVIFQKQLKSSLRLPKGDCIRKELSGHRREKIVEGNSKDESCEFIKIVQERIIGPSYKYHFFRRRDGEWVHQSFCLKSEAIDYKYSSNVSCELVETPREAISLADQIFDKTKSRLFDIDFILSKEGLFFLEVNEYPVPGYFEELSCLSVGDSFSTWMLKEWHKDLK